MAVSARGRDVSDLSTSSEGDAARRAARECIDLAGRTESDREVLITNKERSRLTLFILQFGRFRHGCLFKTAVSRD